MASVTFAIPDKVKSEMKKLSWVNWSVLVREEVIKKEGLLKLLEQLKSKEEQEFIKWSVELGRKAKKGRFKRLLAELSPKEREELLNGLDPEKRKELLK